MANLLLNIYSKEIKFKGNKLVNSLVVQWLRLGAFPAVDKSSIPGQGNKSHKLHSAAKKTPENPQNKKNKTKGKEIAVLKKYLHTSVHCSIIHSS